MPVARELGWVSVNVDLKAVADEPLDVEPQPGRA
jgi:hypothetical protein